MESNILNTCNIHLIECSAVCLETECKNKCFICIECIEDLHSEHKWISYNKFKQKVSSFSSVSQSCDVFIYRDKVVIEADKIENRIISCLINVQEKLSNMKEQIKIKAADFLSQMNPENGESTIEMLSKSLEIASTDKKEAINQIMKLCLVNKTSKDNFIEYKDTSTNNYAKMLDQLKYTCLEVSKNLEKIESILDGIEIKSAPIIALTGIFEKTIKLSELLDSGWSYVYNADYSSKTTVDLIDFARTKVTEDSMILVGVIDSTSPDTFLLCAIDNAYDVLEKKPDAKVAKLGRGGVYWYYHVDKSFGFSPVEKISLGCADHEQEGANQRLSWCVHGTCAGSRIGSRSGVTEKAYRKIILVS